MRNDITKEREYLRTYRKELRNQGWKYINALVPAEIIPLIIQYKNGLMYEYRKKKIELE